MNNAEVFEQIYRSGVWGQGSGSGSSPAYCKRFLEWLNVHIKVNRMQSLMDLGCGDQQIGSLIEVPGYIGVDVVDLGQPQLVLADFTDIAVLRGLVEHYRPDVLLLKDVLQHWPDDQVQAFLPQLLHPPRDFEVIASNAYRYYRKPDTPLYPRDVSNRYRWAPINFAAPPYDRYGAELVMYFRAKQVVRWRPTD